MSDTLRGSTQEIKSHVIEGTLHIGDWRLQSIHARGADADVEVPSQDGEDVVGQLCCYVGVHNRLR